MARPTSLTPAVQAAVVKSVRLGNHLAPSAVAAGASSSSASLWYRRGKGLTAYPAVEPFVSFAEAVDRAIAQWEVETVESLGANPDWRAQERLLSKRIPERWADHGQGDASDALGTIFKAFMMLGDKPEKELLEGGTLDGSGEVADR